MPAYKLPHGETVTAPTSASYEIMPIKNGTDFCATFIINVGKNTGKYCKTNWMANFLYCQ